MHLTRDQHEAMIELEKVIKRLCNACAYLQPGDTISKEQSDKISDCIATAHLSIHLINVIAGGKVYKVHPVRKGLIYVQDKAVQFVLWVCDVVIKKTVK